MLQVKTLTKADYLFAVELANTMNWNMAIQDFEFHASLEPEGVLLLTDGAERLGIATYVSFGKVGWFGNLIVKEDKRRCGGGKALVEHAIKRMSRKGVETVGLYAYPHLQGFYGDLGFKYDKDFSVFVAKDFMAQTADALPAVDKQKFPDVVRFDSDFFGAERKKLLQTIILEDGNASFYVHEGQEIVGYVAATVYEPMAWVGPLICMPERNDAAISLVKAVFSKVSGKTVYGVVAKSDIALQRLFRDFGFKEEFTVSRMYLGKFPAKNCIYMAESLERG
ncbi:MAG: GNAT family N-acetyltransferase [Candidatus Bathyarchaeia archaeon]|jgi:predicted N-acetyltransferase YhbS